MERTTNTKQHNQNLIQAPSPPKYKIRNEFGLTQKQNRDEMVVDINMFAVGTSCCCRDNF